MLMNLVLKGRVPAYARDAIYGSSLCVINKKDGGLRSIAKAFLHAETLYQSQGKQTPLLASRVRLPVVRQ